MTVGWRVEVLLVFAGDALVYRLLRGRPTINQVDLELNPLGPLQGWCGHALRVIC